MKPLKNRVSLTIDDDVLKSVKDMAEKDDRSLSQYINMVLRQHVKNIGEVNHHNTSNKKK